MSLVVAAGCAGSVELMAAIPENEANELLAVLLKANIVAHKDAGKEGMVSLHVEAGKVASALEALRARGLPRERFAGLGEVFRKDGLISSPLEERARYVYALAQELSNTITKIDGVVVARVHVVLPERGSAGDASTPSSAAVFIKYQEGYSLDTVQPQIRRLVTNSIPNLATERVAVIMVPSQSVEAATAVAPQPGAGASGATIPQTVASTAGAESQSDTNPLAAQIMRWLALGLSALVGALVVAYGVRKFVLPRLQAVRAQMLSGAKPALAPAARVEPAGIRFDELEP